MISYVLDTNIILHYTNPIFLYPKSEVIIPFCVIEKLNEFRNVFTSAGKNTNLFIQELEKISQNGNIQEGIVLENGAKVFLYSKNKSDKKLPPYLDEQKTSNQVLLACLSLLAEKKQVVLISNDSNLRIKARFLGIKAQPFEEKKQKNIHTEIQSLKFTSDQFQELQTTDAIAEEIADADANQHYIASEGEKKHLLRYLQKWKRLKKVESHRTVWNISSRNIEQAAAIDLLLDEKISLVFLAGKAGTGKTLLALASAIEQLFNRKYRKILVSRPFVPMGKDMGYLPGDLEEKMSPWMQPFIDTLDFIATYNNKSKYFHPQEIIEKNKIELEALTYIRGKSIPNRFILIDEAQNLTPHEIKTIITRVGEKSKIVLTGDPYQIDNPYLDSHSNGLTYVMKKMKHHDLAGNVFLTKGERSPLAELASNLL